MDPPRVVIQKNDKYANRNFVKINKTAINKNRIEGIECNDDVCLLEVERIRGTIKCDRQMNPLCYYQLLSFYSSVSDHIATDHIAPMLKHKEVDYDYD